MTTPTTIDLQIDRFCNCEGCIRKVKTTLLELGGVKLLAMDPERGKVTISTAKHPEVIQFALQKKFRKVDILSQGISPSNTLSAFDNPLNLNIHQTPSSLVAPQGTINVNDMAKALVTISHAKGLQSVEYTQSNTLKFNITNRENQPTTSRLPPMLHNVRGSNGVHLEDVDFEYVPQLPPPPPQTTKPSAPLIPTTQDQVYGYPPGFYGFSKSSRNDHPHGCCTIL